MSEQPSGDGLPEWDLADRMRKAMRYAGIGVTDMAEYLDVSRKSVGNWISGRILPTTQTIRLWALRCGVDYLWLRGGDGPQPRLSRVASGGGVRRPGSCSPLHRAGLATAA